MPHPDVREHSVVDCISASKIDRREPIARALDDSALQCLRCCDAGRLSLQSLSGLLHRPLAILLSAFCRDHLKRLEMFV